MLTGTAVKQIRRVGERLCVDATADRGEPVTRTVNVVLVVVGVRPETQPAAAASITLGAKGAIAVGKRMQTNHLRCRPPPRKAQPEALCKTRRWPPAFSGEPDLGLALDACTLHDVP